MDDEQVEITGSKIADFTTLRRLSIGETKYEHALDKQFHMAANEQYLIEVILGDSTYGKIKTNQTFKETANQGCEDVESKPKDERRLRENSARSARGRNSEGCAQNADLRPQFLYATQTSP